MEGRFVGDQHFGEEVMSFPKAMMLLFLLVAIVKQSMGTEDPSDFQVVFGGHSAEGQLMTRQETASAPSIAAPSLSATSSEFRPSTPTLGNF